MDQLVSLIIIGLSVYGLASLVTSYDGVKDIFLTLRNKYPRSALICTVCLSVWLVLPIYLAVLSGLQLYLIPLAVIGLIIFLEKF